MDPPSVQRGRVTVPVPSKVQPPPPNRFIRSFTLGTGPTLGGSELGLSSLASSPNQGVLQDTGPRITPMGLDQVSVHVSIPALTAGQQYVATVTIPLPKLPGYTNNMPPGGAGPTPRAPLTSRPSDRVLFNTSMTVQNTLGLTIVRFTAVPQALCGGQTFTGPELPAGQAYSSFSAFCTVVLKAQTATGAGSIVVEANGSVTLQSGGGS